MARPLEAALRRRAVAAALATLLPLAAPAPASAASEAEMSELVRLMRIAAPTGATVVAAGNDSSEGEPLILASLSTGEHGQAVITVAFRSRVGLMAIGSGGSDQGPGACDVILQDTNGDGVADGAEFHCDRVTAGLPKALSLLSQPLFDSAVRALIRRLATV